jgi:hypothetical protein
MSDSKLSASTDLLGQFLDAAKRDGVTRLIPTHPDDIRAELDAKDAEIERLRKDAERWRFAMRHWRKADMYWHRDAANKPKSICLTVQTSHPSPGGSQIESFFDEAISAEAAARPNA